MAKLEAKISFDAHRDEWIAIILDGDMVVCVGSELSETAVREWAELDLLHHAGVEGAEHPRDMYERGSLEKH